MQRGQGAKTGSSVPCGGGPGQAMRCGPAGRRRWTGPMSAPAARVKGVGVRNPAGLARGGSANICPLGERA
jgi:hypothetical protein